MVKGILGKNRADLSEALLKDIEKLGESGIGALMTFLYLIFVETLRTSRTNWMRSLHRTVCLNHSLRPEIKSRSIGVWKS